MLTNKNLFLTVDQGGHASRVMVFNAEGDLVTHHQCEITSQRPCPHYVEHDAAAMLQSIRNCLDKTVEELGDRARYIEAAGIATQRSNVVCWDRQTGEALSPIISWQDTRNFQWMAQLEMDRDEIHRSTGLFPSPHYGASKLRWCLDNLDAVKRARDEGRLFCGPMSSYIVFNLLQENNAYADSVSASRTLLWNINQKDWDDSLLERFGIARELLPECVPTRHEYGHLSIGDNNVPLKIVTGDQSAAMYAYGDVQYETAYINVGTGAFISRPSGHSMIYARRLLTSVIYSEDSESQYVLEGTVNGGGSAIDWMQKHFPVEDLWKKLPEWLKTETNPPLFLNGISGLAAPYWLADFETELLHGGDTAANYVAVIDSIAFLLNANVQEMLKFSSPPQQLQISGGLARLDGLCQRVADLCRLPVYRPKECEATARGAAYLAAGKPSHWPENQHGDWFNPSFNTTVLDRRFLLWEQAMLQRMRKEAA